MLLGEEEERDETKTAGDVSEEYLGKKPAASLSPISRGTEEEEEEVAALGFPRFPLLEFELAAAGERVGKGETVAPTLLILPVGTCSSSRLEPRE